MGTTLRYPYEVRNSKDYFYDMPDVKVAPDMLKLAEHILSSKEATYRSDPVRRSLRAGGASIAGQKAAGHAGCDCASVRCPDHRGQSDGRSAPKHRRRRKGDRDAKEGYHPKTKEGERTHPRSRGTAVADCGAKRATRDGNEARYAADEPTQIWIATISGRHDLIVRSSGRPEQLADHRRPESTQSRHSRSQRSTSRLRSAAIRTPIVDARITIADGARYWP